MIRVALVAACLTIGLSAVVAQTNPIVERQNTMKSIGAATRDGAAIAKGEAPFDAAKVQAIFKTYSDSAKKMATLFPDGSQTGDKTTAAPKIWEDQAGFKASLAKFDSEASAASAAATDLASFRTGFGNVTKNCGTCHETYRVKR
ncbi:cytochrome c [Bosea sp. BK604]|uniref:c-type cytochrome n=1 Tax=Bosea sp. BK604 TaxID=2512180 RepID=UPI001052DF06|nr:cytochrome c [Bosea sp. BK604]TCR63374.1 cytochrome c556 [Bosea sp. BK604]